MFRDDLHGETSPVRVARLIAGVGLLAGSLTAGCGTGPLEPGDVLGAWDVVEWRTEAGRFAVPGLVTLAFGGEATVVYYTYTFSSPGRCVIDVATTESQGSYTDCTYVMDVDRPLVRIEVNQTVTQRGTVSGASMTLVRDLFPVGTDTLVLRKR